MKEHGKKMIAPIVIAILFILYFLGLAALYLWIDGIPGWVKILLVVIPLALAGVMAGTLYSRIKEIRSGEEDDLSQY
ncbi:MAG: efflux RND transporter permease subunit [Fusicatenibacter sp.]|nr:efflux RND transporter permease subunit [Fusicatenibacter sp.]